MNDVVVTGIGLVSSLGVGVESHHGLFDGQLQPVFDRQATAPYPIHPLAPIDFDLLIPKKGDQRQMDQGQRIGVYAAGLALQDGGVLGDLEFLQNTHLIVAAGDGERDVAVDEEILSAISSAEDRQIFFNLSMSKKLRPTLFLAQLPNLLAGNISIVHGVTGSSRTFMGEQPAGLDAIVTMAARIRAGSVNAGLAGGAYSAPRFDMMLHLGLGGAILEGEPASVWTRKERGGGMICGSVGAFLLLESRDHAERRGARISAVLGPAFSEHSFRESGEVETCAADLWARMKPSLASGPLGIISGASGAEPVTAQELASFERLQAQHEIYIRGTGTMIGHALEATAPANLALASLALREQKYFAPFDETGIEKDAPAPPSQIVVTSFGHWRGEGMILLRSARGDRA